MRIVLSLQRQFSTNDLRYWTGDMVKEIRDPYIDCFKGVMILWVIHIHTVYWSGYAYVPELVRQLTLLADVPIFFFISGYVTRPGSFLPLLRQTIKQFTRIYSHYFIISCTLLLILISINTLFSHGDTISQPISFGSMVRMTPHGGLWDYLRVYSGSLWFLRDYLSILVFIPFFLGIREIYKIRYSILVFSLLITVLFPKEYQDVDFLLSSYGNVSFYLFFLMLGVIFREQEDQIDIKSISISFVITVLFSLIIYSLDGGQVDLQGYKFPPSMQYLIFSLLLVHLFMILKYISKQGGLVYSRKTSMFLRWCGINIFYIYLFQGAICSLPYFFVDSMVEVLQPVFIYFLLLCFNVAFTLLACYAFLLSRDLIKSLVKRV